MPGRIVSARALLTLVFDWLIICMALQVHCPTRTRQGFALSHSIEKTKRFRLHQQS